jgi:gluconolactonase
MCVDSDGCLLVCAGGSGSGAGPLVYVLEPSGRVVATHPVPDGAPTNCAFGGAGLNTLFVTTDTGQLCQIKNTGRRGAARFP